MMLSVSTLSAYLYCPRKLFLEKVLSLKEPKKDSLVLGKIRHEIFDRINKIEERLVISINQFEEYAKIHTLYKKEFLDIAREKIINNKSDLREVNLDTVSVFQNLGRHILLEAESRSFHTHSFMLENNVFGNELWNTITPKIMSEVEVQSPKLGLRGVIDKVELYETGAVPVELKTGKTPKEGMWPGHRIQIAAYILLAEEHLKKNITEGFVHYLDSNEKRHFAMNPFVKEEIERLIKEVRLVLQSEALPDFCKQESKCLRCGIRDKCYDQKQVQKQLSDIIIQK